jgi:hypothetical protein
MKYFIGIALFVHCNLTFSQSLAWEWSMDNAPNGLEYYLKINRVGADLFQMNAEIGNPITSNITRINGLGDTLLFLTFNQFTNNERIIDHCIHLK